MVPLVMVCALGGTVGLIWLIKRYHNWSEKKTERSLKDE